MKLPITRELEICQIACITLTKDFDVLDLNTYCAALLRKHIHQLLGQNFLCALSEAHAAQFSLELQRLVESPERAVSFILPDLHGDTVEVRLWKSSDATPANLQLQCILLKADSVDQAEQLLQGKDQLIDSLFDTSLDAIIIADAEGRILEWKGKAEEILGWKAEEVTGQFMHEYIIPPQHRRAHIEGMKRFNATGEIRILNKRIEITAVRKGGEEFPIELTISQIHLNGKPCFTSYLRDIAERKLNEAVIWQRANMDPLTNLPNRRMFEEQLNNEIASAKQKNQSIGLLFIDLDHFKVVNDSYGHSKGDELLKIAARRLSNCVRGLGVVARLGGDEFVVIFNPGTQSDVMDEVTKNIHEGIAKPYLIDESLAFVSASIGITTYPEDGESVEELMSNADQAMYEAKKSGRNMFKHFTPDIKRKAATKTHLANSLRIAMANGELSLRYQPIVDLRNDRVYKVEALLRWQHPELGNISPSVFIPLAEELGLIVQMGKWLDSQVLQQLKRWRKLYGNDFQISINKSPIQFLTDVSAHKRWVDNLSAHALDGANLCIEITENILLNPEPIVYEKLKTYRGVGAEIAIDDFGTGYSSMLYLKDFPLDILKIDRSFVHGIRENSKEAILCEAIISMAHKLGVRVVGEGVETEFQKDFLIRAGCDFGQGYIFALPLSAHDLEHFMTNSQSIA